MNILDLRSRYQSLDLDIQIYVCFNNKAATILLLP